MFSLFSSEVKKLQRHKAPHFEDLFKRFKIRFLSPLNIFDFRENEEML